MTDPAVRRGLWDGLILSGLTAIVVVLTVVVFPSGPDESDSDPEYLWQYFALLFVLTLLFVAIGYRGRRRSTGVSGGPKAGAAAGVVYALMITAIFLAVNNIFFDIVRQQHDKRVSFAASGWTSMRAYINVQQVMGLSVLIPMGILAGIVLGLIGAAIAGRGLARQSTVG